MLSELLHRVRERIETAAGKSGRRVEDITLVAVTKVHPAVVLRDAYALGLRHFGESYVQEFDGKAPELHDLTEARFHLIGHLQSNKVRRAVDLFDVIQSVDSEKVARRINDIGRLREVMIEVKLSPEDAKSGAAPSNLSALVDCVRSCPSLRLTGLMTIPPWSDDPEDSRPYFQQLRRLGEAHGLSCLSMGMSHDFEVAIEEGATHIRVGTALFGQRPQA